MTNYLLAALATSTLLIKAAYGGEIDLQSASFSSGCYLGGDGTVLVLGEPLVGNLQGDTISLRAGFVATLAPTPDCPGDANGDLEVNILDLNIILGNFQQTGAPGIPGDVNRDGEVNILDLNLVLGNFQQICN